MDQSVLRGRRSAFWTALTAGSLVVVALSGCGKQEAAGPAAKTSSPNSQDSAEYKRVQQQAQTQQQQRQSSQGNSNYQRMQQRR